MVKIADIWELLKIGDKSFGMTFFIELSELPIMSHDAITSHKAIPFEMRNCFFSSIVFGVSHLKTADVTFQKRF